MIQQQSVLEVLQQFFSAMFVSREKHPFPSFVELLEIVIVQLNVDQLHHNVRSLVGLADGTSLLVLFSSN